MLSQEFLRERLQQRIDATGPPGDTSLTVIAVLRDFDPPAFAAAALDFVLRLPIGVRAAWRNDFTRTVFLAGNPANLAARFRFRHVAGDGSAAWLGPVRPEHATGMRQLLRTVRGGEVPALSAATVCVPGRATGAPDHREVHVATFGLTVGDYLVHLHHLLAEAAITGLIRPGDRLLLRHVKQIDLRPEQVAEVRVHQDAAKPGLLRAYACLGTGLTEGAGVAGFAVGGRTAINEHSAALDSPCDTGGAK